jgi:hypothetical protein
MIDMLTKGVDGGGMEKGERDYHERLRSTMQHKESEEVSMTESVVDSTIVESRDSYLEALEIDAGGEDGAPLETREDSPGQEVPLETQESHIYKSESVRVSLESSHDQNDSVQDARLERTPPREKPLETQVSKIYKS